MSLLRTILAEAVGMFVDDGMLALLSVFAIAVLTAGVLLAGMPALWAGILLLAGCIAILGWSVLRATAR